MSLPRERLSGIHARNPLANATADSFFPDRPASATFSGSVANSSSGRETFVRHLTLNRPMHRTIPREFYHSRLNISSDTFSTCA